MTRISAWGAVTIASAVVLLTQGGHAFAQEAEGGPINPDNPDTTASDVATYDRGDNTGVDDRARPSFEASGIQVGGFTVYPKVTTSGAYDDNVFGTASGAKGDFIFDVAPQVTIQSNWSRDSLTAYASLDQDVYAHLKTEDTTQYQVGASGKLEFLDDDFTSSVNYGHFSLPRYISNTIGPSVDPIGYGYLSTAEQLMFRFDRVRLSLQFDDKQINFENAATGNGAVVDASQQNHNEIGLTGKAEFAVSPALAVYVVAAGERDMYPTSPTIPVRLDSSGYQVDVGANFDITRLVRGELQLGYLSQVYVAQTIRPIQGPSAKAQVQWFPTPLTTLTLVLSRGIGEGVAAGSAGAVDTNVSVRIDHELLRNLILAGSTWTARNQYIGISRNDKVLGASLSADWLVSRHVGLTFAYTYTNQSSAGTGAGATFADNRGSVALVLQY